VALPKNVQKCYGCGDSFADTTQHRGQASRPSGGTQGRQHRDVGVHRVYSTDFTNTYYQSQPCAYHAKKPVFDGHVHIDLSTYHSLDKSKKEMLKEHGLIVNIVN